MNLAAPTVLVIAGLIPGIAFLNSYYSGHFRRELTGLSPLAEVALFLFWALFIDLSALHLLAGELLSNNAHLLASAWVDPQSVSSTAIIEQALRGQLWWRTGLTYGGVIVGAVVLV